MDKVKNYFGDVRQHLMTGVSYVLPVIIIYAFFMVLGQIPGPLGELCASISTSAQSLIVVVITAYIAFSISGKLSLAPAFAIGLLTETLGMGFIGGIIAGLLMGYIVKALIQISGKIKPGQGNTIITSFIIVPILGTISVGALIYFVIAGPVVAGTEQLNTWLNDLSTGNAILLAAILGAMIAFDMGGPVNKVAYTFAIAASTEGLHHVVAPVLVAITVPVLALGLSTIISKKKYNEEERMAGKTALFMSVFGLTEGAIPFAVVDPFRVIPSIMAGSCVGAILASILSVSNTTVIPSLIGMFLGANNILLYLLCHIVGVAVTMLLLAVLKKDAVEEA